MDKVYFLFDEEDAYEMGYGIPRGEDMSVIGNYYYCACLITRVHSDFDKYFTFRKVQYRL